MLQINNIRENKEEVLKRLAIKNFKNAETIINDILELDKIRKTTQKQGDDLKAESNSCAKQIGDLMKSGKKEEGEALKIKTSELKNTEKLIDEQLTQIELKLHNLLVTVPNTPNLTVPVGKTPEDNEVILEYGEKPTLYSNAKPHWELTSKYNIIDFFPMTLLL